MKFKDKKYLRGQIGIEAGGCSDRRRWWVGQIKLQSQATSALQQPPKSSRHSQSTDRQAVAAIPRGPIVNVTDSPQP